MTPGSAEQWVLTRLLLLRAPSSSPSLFPNPARWALLAVPHAPGVGGSLGKGLLRGGRNGREREDESLFRRAVLYPGSAA